MKKYFTKLAMTMIAFTSLLFMGSAISQNNVHADANDNFQQIYTVAKSKLGSPYIYGATGANAFDCSGFTSYVYKNSLGVRLPRTAQAQYNASTKVSRDNLQKGDLVFIGGSTSSIYHVGMYIGHGKMIDAQNRGVIKESIKAPWWNVVGYGHIND
ncbi:C40 family peptidase [Apilactobacillus quenuiae]|uniref:C40 family peptidase n=1 Tax=Apilactobacillus quenuiae TaxID=2008377 RepID=UPI000D0197E8|nr:NlpC/P60 family protein [Apilactobacillus quenuiae]